MRLDAGEVTTAGYGRLIAFAAAADVWATASGTGVYLRRAGDAPVTLDARQLVHDLALSRDGATVYAAPLAHDVAAGAWRGAAEVAAAVNGGGDGADLAVFAGAWSPDGAHLVVYAEHRPPRGRGAGDPYTGPRRRLLLLDGASFATREVLWEGAGPEAFRAVAADGRRVVAASTRLGVWDATGAHLAWRDGLPGPARRVVLAAWGAAAVCAGGHVVAWRDPQAGPAVVWGAHADDAVAVAAHPSREVLATCGADGMVRLWDPAGTLLAEAQAGDRTEGAAFTPDGAALVVAARRGPDAVLVRFALTG